MPSQISFNCPVCGQEYTVDASLAGRIGTCEICESDFPIPELPVPEEAVGPSEPEINLDFQRTAGIVANIVNIVTQFTLNQDLPWEDQKQQLKQLDRSVVTLRQHLEDVEERRKVAEQLARNRPSSTKTKPIPGGAF